MNCPYGIISTFVDSKIWCKKYKGYCEEIDECRFKGGENGNR